MRFTLYRHISTKRGYFITNYLDELSRGDIFCLANYSEDNQGIWMNCHHLYIENMDKFEIMTSCDYKHEMTEFIDKLKILEELDK